MTGLSYLPGKKDLLKWSYTILTIIFAVVIVTSCTKTPQPYSLIKITGEGTVMNYTKDLYLISYDAYAGKTATLMAEGGDLILLEEDVLYVNDPVIDSINFRNISGATYINGKLYSLVIPKKDSACAVLKEALKGDIAGLKMLNFESSVPENCIPLLEEIAKINPDISLIFNNPFKGQEAILQLFNPRILLLTSLSEDLMKALPGNITPEILITGIGSSVRSQLPAMPSLKKITIISSDIESLPEGFFSANPQIEVLCMFNIDFFDFAQMKPLTGLKNLLINSIDSLKNQDLLGNHNSLEMIAIFSKQFKYDSVLDQLKNIRWMTFPPEIEQYDFDRFVENHPNLEFVELIDCKNVKSLQSLLTLKKLYGLSVANELIDTVSITSFNNLKYLSLPYEILEDSVKSDMLKRALPNTIIVPNEGFCLGSGWLLLLIPFAILFRFVTLKKKN